MCRKGTFQLQSSGVEPSAQRLNGREDEACWKLRIRREAPILMSVAGALIAAATMEGFDTGAFDYDM